MIRFFIFFILLVVALTLTVSLEDPGYVVFNWKGYVLESSLAGFFIILTGAIAALVALRWLLLKTFSIKSSLSSFTGRKHRKSFETGIEAFALGDWKQASDALTRSLKHSDYKEAKHVLIAACHSKLNDETALLDNLPKISRADVAATIKSQWQLDKEPASALTTIEQAWHDNKQDDQLLARYTEALEANESWSSLVSLLPQLEKRRILTIEQFKEKESNWYQYHFETLASRQSPESAEAAWKTLPGKIKKRAHVVNAWIRSLAATGQSDKASALLLNQVKKQGAESVADVIKSLHLAQNEQLAGFVQKQLKKDDSNPVLLSLMGHLALQRRDYDLAKKALKSAMQDESNYQASRQDLLALASAQEQSGEVNSALSIYKKLI